MQAPPTLAVACRSVGSSQRCILTTCAADDTTTGFDYARIADAVNACALGTRQCVGIAKPAFTPAVLLKPVQAELCVGIEIVLARKRLIS